MPYIHVDSEILVDFDDDDLIDELKNRGHTVLKDIDPDADNVELLRKIYEMRRVGKDYQRELDQLIYDMLGRIV